jgi:long-chain acyl-CoA synthetase
MNLIETLDRAAQRWPDKPALVEGEASVSYSGLVAQTHRLARELTNLGVSSGTRVGLSFPNGIAYVALTYALWRVGAVVVPVPSECTEQEAAEIAEAMELGAMVSYAARPGSVSLGDGCYFTRLNGPARPDNHGLNIAFIRFTSGTTSARKGVVLAHETVLERIEAANTAFRITERDTVIWCLPMSHHFLITIVLYLNHGATIVLARHVVAQPFLEAVNRHRGTVLYATPFQFSLLARDKSGLNIDSVRLAVSTTCALTEDVARDFQHRFNRPLSQALGIIEIGLAAVNLDDPIERWSSVGRPLPSHEVRLLNQDDEGCGEVAIRGPGLFDAYAAPWVPREEALRDGWFVTGDIGRVDAEGFLFLLSRKNAVINLAGRKVFPEEIEAVLNQHPAVRESRVFGRVHPHLGEVVEADVALEGDASALEALRQHCRSHLAPYKIPSRFNIVPAVPRTATTGKIRREAALA